MSKKPLKRAYNSLPIKRKLEIINLVENLPPDKKKRDIAAVFGILASTLSTILKRKEVLRSHHTIGSFNDTCSDADVGDELPIVTYSHGCSAFETVKAFYVQGKGAILNFPMTYLHIWIMNY